MRALRDQARYLAVLLRRFRVTFLLLAAAIGTGTALLWAGHREAGMSAAQALAATLFLLMGEFPLALPEAWWLVGVEIALPLVGLAVLADGLVRFGFLYFSKRRNDKEWIAVQSQSMKDHVVLCGGGRVGYRVLGELQKLGMDVVVIERDEKAPFVPTMRRSGAPVLIDDVRDPGALKAVNIAHARAIVCATDDDLANLNLALDARKANPSIRVVIRLFDDDLVENARGALGFEALSTSSLAAPAFAMRAVDPSVLASFELNGRRIVVGEIVAGSWLTGKSPAQVRDETGALVLQASRGGEPFHDAQSGEVLAEGDRLVIQAVLEVYERLSGA